MNRRTRIIFFAPLALLGIALFMAIGGEIVKLLWNWLTPALFGWKTIGFWQALGILALCRILFGGCGFSGGRGRYGRGYRRRMKERWESMTPEEREKFRERFRERWGWVPPSRSPEGGTEGA